jgi:hypothetical protein
VALLQALSTIIQQCGLPYITLHAAPPPPPNTTTQSMLQLGQPIKEVPCQPPKKKKKVKNTGRDQIWVHDANHVQALLCNCANPPDRVRFALSVCPDCLGLAQHTRTQPVKTTCSIYNLKNPATVPCSFCPNAVCTSVKCMLVLLNPRTVLDVKGSRASARAAAGCSQCVRLYSTKADAATFALHR